MSVQNIGTNRWRVKVKTGLDPATGKEEYADKIRKGTRQDAADYEAELRFEANGAPTRRITLSCLFRMWVKDMESGARPRAQNTLDYYGIAIDKHIAPVLGHVMLPDLGEAAIESFFAGLPAGSVRVMCKKTLSASLNWAKRKRMLGENPLDYCEIEVGKGGRRSYDAFSDAECRRILAAARGTDIEAGVLAMLGEGARREEACALDCEDYDEEGGRFAVRRAYVVLTRSGRCSMKGPKNDASWRDLVFEGYFRERLAELMRGRTGPVMQTRGRRMRPDTFYDRFAALLAREGVRYLPVGHLRHTYATRMLQRGVDPETLRQLMGHARLSTILERYVKSSEEAKRRARKAGSEGMSPSGDTECSYKNACTDGGDGGPGARKGPATSNIIEFPSPNVTKTIWKSV